MKKKDHEKKRGSEAQLITEDLNARAKVDRICFECQKDGQLFSYSLTYLDHLSKIFPASRPANETCQRGGH